MRKLLSISFLLTVLLSMKGMKISAHDFEVRNSDHVAIYYIKNSDNMTVSVSYRGSSSEDYCYEYSGDIVIPESVTYDGKTYSVTGIGNRAFEFCSGLSSITIPNSVTSIGFNAFQNCSSLGSVTIGNSVTSIGNYAFYCSGLTSITIPNSVTSIGSCAFARCSVLTTIDIGSGIEGISSSAFAICPNLTDVFCRAKDVPETNNATFHDSNIEYATLHVPDASIELYKAAEPWRNFKEIVGLDGTIPVDPETPKCATPTINYIDGKLLFECETESVEFVYSITTPANTTNQTGNNVDMPHSNTVSVYAKKSGYLNSDVATENIDVRGIQGDTNRDGVVTVADAVGVVNIILEKNE